MYKRQVPPLDLPAEIEVPTPASGLAEVSNLAETSSPTLDFAMDLDFPTESTITEEVVSGLDQKVAEPLEDFTFDLPVTNTDSSSMSASIVSEPEAHTFDLSSINLDLDNPTIQPTMAQSDEFSMEGLTPATTSGLEPQDVEIKLDLVAVYIDMDDKVGARELLDEVIKEGLSLIHI